MFLHFFFVAAHGIVHFLCNFYYSIWIENEFTLSFFFSCASACCCCYANRGRCPTSGRYARCVSMFSGHSMHWTGSTCWFHNYAEKKGIRWSTWLTLSGDSVPPRTCCWFDRGRDFGHSHISFYLPIWLTCVMPLFKLLYSVINILISARTTLYTTCSSLDELSVKKTGRTFKVNYLFSLQ